MNLIVEWLIMIPLLCRDTGSNECSSKLEIQQCRFVTFVSAATYSHNYAGFPSKEIPLKKFVSGGRRGWQGLKWHIRSRLKRFSQITAFH